MVQAGVLASVSRRACVLVMALHVAPLQAALAQPSGDPDAPADSKVPPSGPGASAIVPHVNLGVGGAYLGGMLCCKSAAVSTSCVAQTSPAGFSCASNPT
jgi:hypothetical protein